MRIQLPTETWIEILDWLRRRDLVKKLDKLWDREFTPIVQDWLHKYTRNVCIEGLSLNQNGGLTSYNKNDIEKVPIAKVPMPENIVSFKWIHIDCLNSNLLAFLHLIRPLFRDIHYLWIIGNGEELPMRTVLRHLMPLLDGSIECISMQHESLQFLADNFPASIRFNAQLICFWGYETGQSELLINWLFTPRQDGQPRTLVFFCWESFDDFGMKVRERFLDPARQLASPFFVRIEDGNEWVGEIFLIPSVTENSRIGERLTVQKVEHGTEKFGLITNCPLDANAEWLAKKTREVLGWDKPDQRLIEIESPVICDNPNDVEEEQQQEELADEEESDMAMDDD